MTGSVGSNYIFLIYRNEGIIFPYRYHNWRNDWCGGRVSCPCLHSKQKQYPFEEDDNDSVGKEDYRR